MEKLVANRRFVYAGHIDTIKEWLTQLGYATEDVLGYDGQPAVLRVLGTHIKIGYHRPLNEFDTGRPTVHLLQAPGVAEADVEQARRGLLLYPKLYRKFREKRKKPA